MIKKNYLKAIAMLLVIAFIMPNVGVVAFASGSQGLTTHTIYQVTHAVNGTIDIDPSHVDFEPYGVWKLIVYVTHWALGTGGFKYIAGVSTVTVIDTVVRSVTGSSVASHRQNAINTALEWARAGWTGTVRINVCPWGGHDIVPGDVR